MLGRITQAVVFTIGAAALAFSTLAEPQEISVTFVELLNEDGNAVLVVEAANGSSETVTKLTFGCWTEQRRNIDSEEIAGSSLSAFNTGPVTWAGELAPGATQTIRGVIDGLPGAMVVVFEGQYFGCGTS